MIPPKRCYWVVPGAFIAGPYPGRFTEDDTRERLAVLLDAGVTAFVDLTEEGELPPYAGVLEKLGATDVSARRFAIPDHSAPSSRQLVREALDQIDEVIASGGVVCVHCFAGIGRTGTIVGCWLSRHGYPGQAALQRLAELWRSASRLVGTESPETLAQRRYVVTWDEG